MKTISRLGLYAAALLVANLSSMAFAVPMVSVEQDMTAGGNDRYNFSVDAAGEEYDTIEVIVENGEINQAGGNTIFALPSEDTGFIGEAIVFSGGSVVAADDTTSRFSGVAGFQAPRLISNEIAAGQVFFQAVLPSGGQADYIVNFLRGGQFIDNFQSTGLLGIPEPTSIALIALGVAGCLSTRRR